MATLPGAWHYRVSTGTGRPDVSILWLGEVERLICSFYLSVAARKIVWTDLSLRYTNLLLGRWATNQPTNKLLSVSYVCFCSNLSVNFVCACVCVCANVYVGEHLCLSLCVSFLWILIYMSMLWICVGSCVRADGQLARLATSQPAILHGQNINAVYYMQTF